MINQDSTRSSKITSSEDWSLPTYCRESPTVYPAKNTPHTVHSRNPPVCQLPTQSPGRSKFYECVRHPKRRVKFFCKSHSAYLCSDCIIIHLGLGHDVVAYRPSAADAQQQIRQLTDQTDLILDGVGQTVTRLTQLGARLQENYDRELNMLHNRFDNATVSLQAQKAGYIATLQKHEQASKVAIQMNRHTATTLMARCQAIVDDTELLSKKLSSVSPDQIFTAITAKRSELASLKRTLLKQQKYGDLYAFQGIG